MKVRRDAWVEEVIVHKVLIGEGIKKDPYRELLIVRKKNGEFIADRDEWGERHGKPSRRTTLQGGEDATKAKAANSIRKIA